MFVFSCKWNERYSVSFFNFMTGNKPPGLVPNKFSYMAKDLDRLAIYFDVPLHPPADPFEVMFQKGKHFKHSPMLVCYYNTKCYLVTQDLIISVLNFFLFWSQSMVWSVFLFFFFLFYCVSLFYCNGLADMYLSSLTPTP